MEIRDPTAAELDAFFGAVGSYDIRDIQAGFVDGKCVAMAGVIRDPRFAGSVFEEDGRWIGFLQLAPGIEAIGAKAVFAMRKYLRAQTEPIVVQCDDAYKTATRLLGALGFTPTDEVQPDFRLAKGSTKRNLRIWQWHP